jgi:hypothetical protein
MAAEAALAEVLAAGAYERIAPLCDAAELEARAAAAQKRAGRAS